MTIVNEEGYIVHSNGHKNRDWWMIKYHSLHRGGIILGAVILPEKYVGKRVKFKVEVLDD